MRNERRAAFALTLLALLPSLATPARAEGDVYAELESAPVSVRAWCPWPASLDKGFLPIYVRLENHGSEAHDVEIDAESYVPRGPNRVRRRVPLEAGDRISVELFAPVAPRWSSHYAVGVSVDGREPEAIGHVGASEHPQGHAATNAARAVVLFTDAPPSPAELATWTEDLSWAQRVSGHAVVTLGGPSPAARSTSTPKTVAHDNVRLVTAPLVDLPRRAASLSSLDLVVLDLTAGLPSADRVETLFTWVRQGGVVLVGGLAPERRAELEPLAPWLEERFRIRTEDGFDEVACGLGRALLTFGPPLATEVDRARAQNALLEVNGWTYDPSGSRWEPHPGTPSGRWIPEPTIPSLDELPFRTFTVLLILFALLIGPLNFALVQRLGRPVLLLVTIPSIALVCTLLVVGYGIFWQGVDVRVAAQSLTVLDQREHRATTALERLMFAGLSPGPGLRPGAGTVLCAKPSEQWSGANGNLRVDDRDGTLLAGDYLPVRRRARQVILSDRSARGRLVVDRTSAGLEVQNGLGTTLDRLLVRDATGAFHRLESPLSPDETATLVPTEAADAETLAAALWPVEVPVGPELVPPAAWLALARSNPFADDCGIEVNEVAGTHRVLGLLPLAGPGGER